MIHKIIISEDDPDIVDAMQTILEMNGYKVTTTCDGPTVRLVEDMLPDVLLLDILMPGMDGKTIFKKIRSREKTKHIPIIMVSAIKDLEQVATEIGADGYLTKPFEMNDLLSTVKKHLNV